MRELVLFHVAAKGWIVYKINAIQNAIQNQKLKTKSRPKSNEYGMKEFLKFNSSSFWSFKVSWMLQSVCNRGITWMKRMSLILEARIFDTDSCEFNPKSWDWQNGHGIAIPSCGCSNPWVLYDYDIDQKHQYITALLFLNVQKNTKSNHAQRCDLWKTVEHLSTWDSNRNFECHSHHSLNNAKASELNITHLHYIWTIGHIDNDNDMDSKVCDAVMHTLHIAFQDIMTSSYTVHIFATKWVTESRVQCLTRHAGGHLKPVFTVNQLTNTDKNKQYRKIHNCITKITNHMKVQKCTWFYCLRKHLARKWGGLVGLHRDKS